MESVHFIDLSITEKIKAYYELMKPRLSFLVVFSSSFGYLLVPNIAIDWFNLVLFAFGGFLISGASVTVNQILEKDLDAMMTRTKERPLPEGKISVNNAWIFSFITFILGIGLIAFSSNLFATGLSILSTILYAFVYTPLKKVGSVAVFIGAIPGALPPLIGWVAASGFINYQALIIFGIQFIWQFPHFWAIAWVLDEDYKKAGFKLLPAGGAKNLNTAINIMVYTLFLIPLGLLPTYFSLTGLNSGVIATICGVLFLAQTFSLMKDTSNQKAKRIMFGSFIYLPIVQIAFLIDKI